MKMTKEEKDRREKKGQNHLDLEIRLIWACDEKGKRAVQYSESWEQRIVPSQL